MSKSIRRVQTAAESAGLAIDVKTMPDSTRTAQDAATACGCEVGQITKSLVFEGIDSGELKLLLVSGQNQVDLDAAAKTIGEPLQRANPKDVRSKTSFAIGGIPPFGHTCPLDTWIDSHLLNYETIWAAAGTPNAVFSVDPQALKKITGARLFM